MQIIRTPNYISQLKVILNYIALDKFSASKKFKFNLDENIKNLINFPYKYKQSDYYANIDIRDMTFKGYSIIYRVNKSKKVIDILEIFNRNLPQVQNFIS